MDFALIIYLASVVGDIAAMVHFATFVAIFLLILASLLLGIEDCIEELKQIWRNSIRWVAALCFASAILPSSSVIDKMIVAYGAQYVATAEEAQEIGGKSLQAINKMLDEYLAEESE